MLERTYQLYIKIDHRWVWSCEIRAGSHEEAFRKAMMCLSEEQHDKPVRLEQEDVLDKAGE